MGYRHLPDTLGGFVAHDPTSTGRVITEAAQLDFALSSLPARPREVRVLMADPAHFDVLYVINTHMAGNVGSVDTALAQRQWEGVRDAYADIGFPIACIDGVEGLPDLVFMANQSFPGQLPDGRWAAFLSHMHNEERRPEVEVVADWYRGRGALLFRLSDPTIPFEGMGDVAWVPGRRAIIGGHGFRTDARVYPELAERFAVPTLALKLVDDRFYHLDTCLQLIDDRTALYVPAAFDDTGRALLQAAFPRLVEVPEDEAAGGLACNGHCPDGKHFIVHTGNPKTVAAVQALGLTAIEVDTGEFLKSGGSVYCMKLMVP
jgi:N-dimethylarginine dimethylaminohydrolase